MGSNQAKVTAAEEKCPFKDGKWDHAIDLNSDIVEILKRYDTALRAIIVSKVRIGWKPFTLLTRELTKDDIGRNIQGTVIDFATSHALQGGDYVGDIQNNMQYTVLQAALILTITVSLYIDPPSFDTERTGHLFSAIVGFSAICHLSCIIGCTILAALFNAAYSEIDGTIALLQSYLTLTVVTIFNYIAIITTMISMLVAGYGRSKTDGNIQLIYSCVAIFLLVRTLIRAGGKGAIIQDSRTFKFYKEYCDPNGELKDKYLQLIQKDDKKDDKLEDKIVKFDS